MSNWNDACDLLKALPAGWRPGKTALPKGMRKMPEEEFTETVGAGNPEWRREFAKESTSPNQPKKLVKVRPTPSTKTKVKQVLTGRGGKTMGGREGAIRRVTGTTTTKPITKE